LLPRYGDVAVLLHWSMALLIISLLAFGKFTATLDETSALYTVPHGNISPLASRTSCSTC